MKIKHLKKCLKESKAPVVKSLDAMTDEEFSGLIDEVLNHVDAVEPVAYSSDIEARVNKINSDANNTAKNSELEQEDNFNRAEARRKKTRDAEKAKYAKVGGYQGLQAFKDSLSAAIRLQIDFVEDEDETYSEPNKRFAHDDTMLVKGTRLDELPGEIPHVIVYFDQSPSWGAADIKVGENAVQCLVDLDSEGAIDLDIRYFSDSVYETADAARRGRGTGAWPEILRDIKKTGATNVVIMTDADMDEQPYRHFYSPRESYPTTVVQGGVWWLWRDGIAGKRITKELRGSGTIQPNGYEEFSFSSKTH